MGWRRWWRPRVAGCDPEMMTPRSRRGPRRDSRAPRPARRVRAPPRRPVHGPPLRTTTAAAVAPRRCSRCSARSRRGGTPRVITSSRTPTAPVKARPTRRRWARRSRSIRRGRRRARDRVGVLRDAHPPGQGGGQGWVHSFFTTMRAMFSVSRRSRRNRCVPCNPGTRVDRRGRIVSRCSRSPPMGCTGERGEDEDDVADGEDTVRDAAATRCSCSGRDWPGGTRGQSTREGSVESCRLETLASVG